MDKQQALYDTFNRLSQETIWNEMPGYPVKDWQREVEENETRLGYWDWVECQIEQFEDEDEEDPTPQPECGHSACRQNWIDTGESACVGFYTACCEVFVTFESLACPACGKAITPEDQCYDR